MENHSYFSGCDLRHDIVLPQQICLPCRVELRTRNSKLQLILLKLKDQYIENQELLFYGVHIKKGTYIQYFCEGLSYPPSKIKRHHNMRELYHKIFFLRGITCPLRPRYVKLQFILVGNWVQILQNSENQELLLYRNIPKREPIYFIFSTNISRYSVNTPAKL